MTFDYPTLWLSQHGSARVEAYHSSDSCCDDVTWAKPHTLLFDDDYRVFRLDPLTRKHTMIASWDEFVVSRDGRWIAGWRTGLTSAAPAETVGVLSTDGKTCLAVPQTSHESDEAVGFSRDGTSVIVKRWPFVPNNGTTGSPRLVAYTISSLPASKDC